MQGFSQIAVSAREGVILFRKASCYFSKVTMAGMITHPSYDSPEWVSWKRFSLESADSAKVRESRTPAIALLSLASCSVNHSISDASTDLQRWPEAN